MLHIRGQARAAERAEGSPRLLVSALAHVVLLAGAAWLASPSVRLEPRAPQAIELVMAPATMPSQAPPPAPEDASPPVSPAEPPAPDEASVPAAEIASASAPEAAAAPPPAPPEPSAAVPQPEPVQAAAPPSAEPDVAPLPAPAIVAVAPTPEPASTFVPPKASPMAHHAPARPKPREAHPPVPDAKPQEPPPPSRDVTAPGPTVPAHPAAAVVGASWRSAVAAWLAAHKRYPEAARQNGEEGAVGVLFTVARDGRVASVSIPHPSGSATLDHAVRAMLEGQRLPSFPPEMAQAETDVAVTIRYRLDR